MASDSDAIEVCDPPAEIELVNLPQSVVMEALAQLHKQGVLSLHVNEQMLKAVGHNNDLITTIVNALGQPGGGLLNRKARAEGRNEGMILGLLMGLVFMSIFIAIAGITWSLQRPATPSSPNVEEPSSSPAHQTPQTPAI